MGDTAQSPSRGDRKGTKTIKSHTFFGSVNDGLVAGGRTRRRHAALDGGVERRRLRALAAKVCSLASYRRGAIEDTILSAAWDRGQGDVEAVLCDNDSAGEKRERV